MKICDNWKKEYNRSNESMESERKFENLCLQAQVASAKTIMRLIRSIFKASGVETVSLKLDETEAEGYQAYVCILVKCRQCTDAYIMVRVEEKTGELIFSFDKEMRKGMVSKEDYPLCNMTDEEFVKSLTEEPLVEILYQTKSIAEIVGFVSMSYSGADDSNVFFDNGFRSKPMQENNFVSFSEVVLASFIGQCKVY